MSRLLSVENRSAGSIRLRRLRAGDLGWVIQRHGEIDADEHGWTMEFDAPVARIVAEFANAEQPDRQRAWIAELDGARAGCIFCCRENDDTAKLRILLVEPWARGCGIGGRLVDTCIRFARKAGYRRITLWTNSVLDSARRRYETAGFELVDEALHRSFGQDLIGQTWTLEL